MSVVWPRPAPRLVCQAASVPTCCSHIRSRYWELIPWRYSLLKQCWPGAWEAVAFQLSQVAFHIPGELVLQNLVGRARHLKTRGPGGLAL